MNYSNASEIILK